MKKIFLTGASGFIGSAVAQELIRAGYGVTGLARSDSAAQALLSAGIQVHRGDIEDLESLRKGALESDGVIHTAFNHDFSKFKENCEIDRRAIEALGSGLVDSKKRFVVASGITAFTPGRLTTEEDPSVPSSEFPRGATSEALKAVANLGVDTSLVRIPPMVHNQDKQGIASMLIDVARKSGISAYVGDGSNRWPAVHRLDVAHLFRIAFEKGTPGSRYHAVAEEGISLKDVASAIAKRLSLPLAIKSAEEATTHFGWLAPLLTRDLSTSSNLTKNQLGWGASQVGLISDIEHANL